MAGVASEKPHNERQSSDKKERKGAIKRYDGKPKPAILKDRTKEKKWRRVRPPYTLNKHIVINRTTTRLKPRTPSTPLSGNIGGPNGTEGTTEDIEENLPPGVENLFAINVLVVLSMMVIMVIIFFGCIIFLVRYYYKDREEELMNGSSFVNERPIVRIEKEKSPYVITPTQKITQQFLSGQKAPALIECNSEDIAGVLDFMAANIETLDDSAFRPANVRMRLVPRAKTRFDDASMPPFEVQPTLQKMIFAQSPKFQIGAAMNELNKRKLNERDRKPSSKSKQNKQVRNKSTPKWQKAAQKTQLGHIRSHRKRREHSQPKKKEREGKADQLPKSRRNNSQPSGKKDIQKKHRTAYWTKDQRGGKKQ